jgi:signal transduction histidine kinase
MSNLFQLDNNSIKNHNDVVKKITGYIEICKNSSKTSKEKEILNSVSTNLGEYNSFFLAKIVPFFNKQYDLYINSMSYSRSNANETDGPIQNNTTNNEVNKMNSTEYYQFLKDLEIKLEESRNQIDIAKKNQLNFDGSQYIEKMQKEIDTLEAIYTIDSKNAIADVNQRTNYVSVLSIIIIVLVGIYITIAISNSISKPIKMLVQKMHLVEEGNMETTVCIDSTDEFGLLGNSFNNMVISLCDANREIVAHQQELTYLNKVLTESNDMMETAYKELKQTQIQLIQQEKMASLGMLVSGVAHEINTPLGAINCNVDLYKVLIGRLKDNPIVAEDINAKEIVSKLDLANHTNVIACERIMNIVRSLKSFARLDEAEYQITDVHQGLENTLLLLNNRIKNKVEIIKDFGDVPNIWCYPNQLNQVSMNLLGNAIDSLEEKGTIWIKTYTEGNNLFIKVRDNGGGISPENLNKIFDPGFTTKGVGVGTGLGLSIVFNIIEKHKGKIWAKSELGKGTEFTVQIPTNLSERI